MTLDLSIMEQIREIAAAGWRNRPAAAAAAAQLTHCVTKGYHKLRAPRSRVLGA
jgi:hypothetical protein